MIFLFGPPDVENLKAKKDVEGLTKALEYKKDNDVRAEAAVALGKLRDERAIEPIIHALKDKDGGKVEMIKEISKCEESVFTCPYCHGSGSVKGWSPNQKGSVTYPGSKHGCNQCEGIGKLKSIVEGKLKIEITKLPLVPLFIIKAEINLFHKKGGPANVGTVITLDWGKINIENTEYLVVS